MPSVLEAVSDQYGDQIQVIYRHFPLISIHDKASITAQASEAAGAQDMFWEYHDLLYEKQDEWSSQSVEEVIDTLVGYAEEIGLADIDQFRADLENGTYEENVMAEYQAARDAGLSGTPTVFINRVDYPAQSFGLSPEGLGVFIQLMQLRDSEQWYSDGPAQVIDPTKEYIATIETTKGDIVIELFPDTAPVNVNSFVFLAQQDWYAGTTFHRVLPDFVAQGGDPTSTGLGYPGYRCSDEVVESRTFDEPGLVSLANSGPDSNGGQFFITYDAVPQLNDTFTIIGRVIEGQDVVASLSPRDPQEDYTLPPGDEIINITVTEKES